MRRKSHAVSILVTLLFGPLGLMYSSVWQGLVMLPFMVVSFAAMSLNLFVGAWVLCIVLGASAVNTRNNEIDRQEELEERRHNELVSAAIRTRGE